MQHVTSSGRTFFHFFDPSFLMTGILYLIPNTLGPCNDNQHPLAHIIPETVQAMSAQLHYFVAEKAKTARAHLKLINQFHPLSKPIQELHIAELHVNTPATELDALIAPLLQGHDVGLISEAGVPAVADPGANPFWINAIAIE